MLSVRRYGSLSRAFVFLGIRHFSFSRKQHLPSRCAALLPRHSGNPFKTSFLVFPHQTGNSGRSSGIRHYSSSSAPRSVSLDNSLFYPSLDSLVDLSDYLKNGCNWREAPSCPDYVGPISIARTPDGRGRGLYVTCNVKAGDILIMNNAFAATYNDVQSIELYAKISAIVKQSPEALRKFYCLGGYDYHDDMEVPNVKLFDSNSNYKESNTPRDLQFDEKRIMHIMNVNSFEGDLYSTDTQQPATRLTGVWFLPSFINHSCSPNSSRLVVGEAMFIIASRDIAEKEEITISYIDGMFPLKIREEKLAAMGYGFHCQCRRCEAERSVQSELKEYSSQYHELYENAALEVQGAVTSTVHTHIENCPACTELSAVYDGILGKLNSLSSLTNLEKQWILGGYSSAFLAKWLVCGYASGFSPPSDFATPQALQLVEAMKATVPGMLRTLSFATMLATAAQKDKNQVFALVHRLIQLALDECIRVYGKQKFDVVSKLMEQSAEFVPFF